MAGVNLVLNTGDLVDIGRRLNAWAGALRFGDALESIGAEVESQTRRRLEDKEGAPDGTPWAPWSERYAATRVENQSMLESSGALIDSIQWDVIGDDVQVGTDRIYGAVHQFGFAKRKIPARPYLGLSTDNEQEVLDVMTDYLQIQIRNF